MFQISENIIRIPSVDSTNNYAANLVKDGEIGLGTAIMADYQTGGRGQRGTTWHSPSGKNLLLSICLPGFQLTFSNFFILSKWFAFQVSNHLNTEYGLKSEVKWPNDILINGKKVAGTLIESVMSGGKYTSHIIGVGLNVNQLEFPEDVNGTSLQIETKKVVAVQAVAQALLQFLNSGIALLELAQYDLIEQQYLDVLWNMGKRMVEDLKTNTVKELQVFGVNNQGELLALDLANNSPCTYSMKEIRWLG
ncbi:MAG: BirA family biotin operon repressor/biotin-[acetyl-CoA-carboxylase] ligase [Luteibaculaceae bacterium]